MKRPSWFLFSLALALTAVPALAAPVVAPSGTVSQTPLIAGGTVHQFSPEPYGGSNIIGFSNGLAINTDVGQPDLPAGLRIDDYPAGRSGYYLVQFSGPIQDGWRQALESMGALVISYLPNYAYLVSLDPSKLAEVQRVPSVKWVGLYQPAYKISGQPELKQASGTVTVLIHIFRDQDFDLALDDLEQTGATVLETSVSKWNLFVKADIDLSTLDRIANLASVCWIEPWYPNRLYNDRCQWVVQDNTNGVRTIWAHGLRGEDQVLSSSDSGVRMTHRMFYDPSVPLTTWGDYPTHRKVVAYKQIGQATFGDEAVNYYHGSHTGGTLCGDDSINNGASAYDGMAYKARLYFMDGGGSTGGIWGYNDLAYLFGPPHGGVPGYPETRAFLMSNSWGAQQTSGPMPYDAECMSLDQYAWDHKDFLPFFSQGNNDYGLYPYIGRPAVAKNCVAVGASRNGTNAGIVATWSSSGPTQDGRLKPMIVAPGDGQNANTGLWSVDGSSDTLYLQMAGTSMSCPATASASVLIRQYFTEGWYPSGTKTPADAFAPTAALLKATLLAGADKGSPAIPNAQYGWGRVDLDSSLYFSGDYRKLAVVDDTIGLQTGQYKDYLISIPDSLCQMRAALCWTDYPGSPGAGRMLVNDLDLTVTDPYGTQYKGNVFSASVSATGGSADTLNVEENFRRLQAAYRPGTWKLRISARNTPQGPQPYALAISGPVSGSLSWTPAPLIGIQSTTVLDAGQSRPNSKLDPGETDSIRIVLVNNGPIDATTVIAKLRTTSGYVTKVDTTADYGTVAANGGTSLGDNFLVTMSAGTPEGTTVPFTLHWVDGAGDSADIAFSLVCGIARYATYDHKVGNVLLTVTKWGSIGYLTVAATGNGFKYPQSTQWLYHSSFLAGNANNYIVDRFFPNTGQTGSDSANTDWKCLTQADSGVTALGAVVSLQDSWAQFNDSSAFYKDTVRTKGLTVTQEGYAWQAPYDFVILRYKLKQQGPSSLTDMYAGIIADFDMGASTGTNLGAADTLTHYAVYERQQTTQKPCVGLKLLQGTFSNASLLKNNWTSAGNPGYVYNGGTNLWNDSTAFKFLRGAIKKVSALATADTADYSSFISAGPFTLNSGDSTFVAFAFVAADTAPAFWSMCDSAQAMYDRTFIGVEGSPLQPTKPMVIALGQNRPNPFAGATAINYQLPAERRVQLRVYNISGQLVRTLVDDVQKAGSYAVKWDGRDGLNHRVAAGVYIYSLDVGGAALTRKMILIK